MAVAAVWPAMDRGRDGGVEGRESDKAEDSREVLDNCGDEVSRRRPSGLGDVVPSGGRTGDRIGVVGVVFAERAGELD